MKNKKVNFSSQIETTQFMREGESLEQKLRRVNATKEPIDTNQSPEIYQAREAGVDFACDIRTDRFEVAQSAMNVFTKTHMAARKNKEKFGTEEATTIVLDENGNFPE